ncbi:MAG: hypothetical protein J0H31_18930 [Alphaproteobacteria bacterium]|nr:hypothetical protein [Alphaproteobacteria bacterium]
MSQPLYRIVATRRCKTHRPGSQIDFTGPRSSVPKGWSVLGRYKGRHWVTSTVIGNHMDAVEY